MNEPISHASAFAFARAAVRQNPALLQAIISGAMEGQREREDALREKLSSANDVVAALAMAADSRSTPNMKKHMERVAVRHLAPNAELDCQAVRDFVAARSP